MNTKLFFLFILYYAIGICHAQESTVELDTSMFDKYNQTINLSQLDSWLYKKGNDTLWKEKEIDISGWRKINPTQFSIKDVDKYGRLEGWLRLRFTLSGSFENMPVGIQTLRWAATDIYLDGNHIASYGNTGINGQTYKENSDTFFPLKQFYIETGVEYVLAVHIVDYLAPYNPNFLKSETFFYSYGSSIVLTGPEANRYANLNFKNDIAFSFLCCGVTGILVILFWFLYVQQNRIDKNLLLISISTTFFFLWGLMITLSKFPFDISFNTWWWIFFPVINFGHWQLPQ